MSVWQALTTRQIARIMFTAAAFLGVMYLLVQIRGTLLLLGIAIFLAVALGPAVDLFNRWLARAAAILLVYLLIFLVFAGVLALVVPPVVNGASDLSRDIPNYIEDLRNNGTFRDFDNKYNVTQGLKEQANELPSRLGDAAGVIQSVATGAFNAAFQLLTILTMTFFLLLDGKRIVAFVLRRLGRKRAGREELWYELAARIYRSTAGYVAGALTISTINGITTVIVLTLLGVDFAVPLAVLMAFFGLIPLVGATIGGVIILVVTLFTDFPQATIIYAIVLIAYQQVENNVLQPFVYKRTVNVPPLAVIVAILAGAALLGVVGALIAIPIAAALQIMLREFYGEEPKQGPPLAAPPPSEPPGGPSKKPPSGGGADKPAPKQPRPGRGAGKPPAAPKKPPGTAPA